MPGKYDENLLAKTEELMQAKGYAPAQIVFIGSTKSGHSCTWEEFKKLADFSYYPGYGCAEVATDLEIIFSDGARMIRQEYDGAEWWIFLLSPTNIKAGKLIKTLRVNYSGSKLSDKNQ
jgi:hypothetical protein